MFYMKRILLSFAALFAAANFVSAQVKPVFDPDCAWNTLRAECGVLIPLGTDLADNSLQLSLSYTKLFSDHWGWRAGATYAFENTAVRDFVGAPMSMVYRSYTANFDGRMRDAAIYSAEDVVMDGVMGYGTDRMARDVFTNFLGVLFRGFEVYAGVTPGYVFGDGKIDRVSTTYYSGSGARTELCDAGIQLNRRFTLTADAGVTFSIPIHRVSLNLSPGFHYLLTNNFSEYHQDIDPATFRPVGQPTLRPLRWQVSLSAGISYLF